MKQKKQMSFYLTNVNILGNKKNNDGNNTKIEKNKSKYESPKNINAVIDNNLKNVPKINIKTINNENNKKIIDKTQVNPINKLDKITQINLKNDIKNNYFTFLIDNNIKYANLNKVEQYYYNEIFKKNKIYNNNL